VAERIAQRRLFLWCDPEPVSMAGWSGRTANGVRINFVYTPRGCRRRGYASACVAALSQHLLDSGRRFCTLFTDLANPTSNKIYRSIGYEHVGNFKHVEFA
jgi:predicted GNAT family acetyltransferase